MPVSIPVPVARSTKHPTDSSVRQLKWLVVILVISNVALGLFSMVMLRRADRRYSELINRSVPVLNDLQTLTAEAAQAMVATNPVRLETMSAADFARTAKSAITDDASLRTTVMKENWLTDASRDRQEMVDAGQAFTTTATNVLALIESGKTADATRARERQLRPAFDRYVIAITKAADVLEDESHKANDTESKHTNSVSTVMIGFATWPIVVVGALLVLTALFVLVLMVLFRGREMTDVP